MVIRAIRSHVATHDWFAVSIDVLIVVVGVFLGTQANNWNADRIAARDARTHRERLIEDVDSNQIDFAGRKAYYESVRVHALAALAEFGQPTPQSDEALVVDAYQASQINARLLRRSTYEELVSEGALSTLGSPALRDIAEAFYQGLRVLDDNNDRLPPYRDRVRRELPYPVVSAIRRQCGDRVREHRGALISSLPPTCRLDLDPTIVRRAAMQLREAPGIERDLSQYIVDLDVRLGNFAGSDRRANTFRNALRQADAPS